MAENVETEQEKSGGHFDLDMTIAEAMAVHPRVREVFAAFHLGGCGHCALGQVETIGQVCAGYGVDADQLLQILEELVERDQAQG